MKKLISNRKEKIRIRQQKDIQKKHVNQAMVKHIIQCANSLGLKTCIEGVENEELSIFLRPNEASYYQGYYYSKPIPAEDFKQLLT